MKPFERDHHAAQPSVGFHAKPGTLPALLALEPLTTRSPPFGHVWAAHA